MTLSKVFELSGLSVSRYRRSLWLYPLFQIPLMCLGAFLVAAALFWLLGLGRAQVSVAIALDLSASTYQPQPFNAPGTIMSQEVAAVRAYVQQNNQLLRNPNQVQIFGFGGVVRSLSDGFTTDSNKLETELNQSLQNPDLPQLVATDTTDLNLAIQKGTQALSTIPEPSCRELLLVTDGEGRVSNEIVDKALQQRVRINAVVVGANASAPELGNAAARTGGIYLPSIVSNNLIALFIDRFFTHFNTNLKWIILWLGCAWIALMWMLTMPLDRWIFQGLMKLEMPLAGQLSLGNALFWSILTPLIIWQLWKLLGWPFFTSC